jgi:Sulfotransferase family
VRARTPDVSKFRHRDFEFSDDERRELYCRHVERTGRSRANNMAAFYRATFEAWKDYNASGRESFYVGYSPIIGVDGEKILTDLPEAHVLHVVRNPWSAYADTKKRPVPLSLEGYLLGWTLNQHYSLLFARKFPERFHILRAEDVMGDPVDTLGGLCEKLGLQSADTLATPSWNGSPLKEVYPWGTIRTPTPEANHATALELSAAEQSEVAARAWQYLDLLGYSNFLRDGVVEPAAL